MESVPVDPRTQGAFCEVHVFADRSRIGNVVNAGPSRCRHRRRRRPTIKSLGDELTFAMNYSALLAAMTSEYMEKRLINSAR